MSQKQIQFSLETKRAVIQTVEFELSIESEKGEQLQEYYSRLFDQLVIDGIEPSRVYEVGKQLVLEEKSRKLSIPVKEVNISSWFWQVCRKKCGQSTQLEQESQQDPIYTVFEQIINRLQYTITIIEDGIDKFKILNQKCKDENIDQDRFYEKKQLKEFLHQWDCILKLAHDGFDEKTKIPKHTQLILLYSLASESSITNGAKIFMKARLELMEELGKFLTAKQAGKFQRGEIKDELPILKPYNRESALFLEYWGDRCIKCNSWRVKDFIEGMFTRLKCIDCEEVFEPINIHKCRRCQVPLYKEDLQFIISNGHCKNCKNEIKLPQALIDYAQS